MTHQVGSQRSDIFEVRTTYRPIPITHSEEPTINGGSTKFINGSFSSSKINKLWIHQYDSETSWSHENILKLIQEVETRRSLWDVGYAEYKLHKDNLWQEVADAIPATFIVNQIFTNFVFRNVETQMIRFLVTLDLVMKCPLYHHHCFNGERSFETNIAQLSYLYPSPSRECYI
ncbi:hypothetical protein FF38_00883 [Lucilia cuprina]|uniref:MADF domain-containing protein n=1 Tax=Lucilia cuprina TaxID=7375 RepID=A0A0L0BTJ1_LUCCU|nr:hypothetical protein FF38_00883 [Lucilia cuprina]